MEVNVRRDLDLANSSSLHLHHANSVVTSLDTGSGINNNMATKVTTIENAELVVGSTKRRVARPL